MDTAAQPGSAVGRHVVCPSTAVISTLTGLAPQSGARHALIKKLKTSASRSIHLTSAPHAGRSARRSRQRLARYPEEGRRLKAREQLPDQQSSPDAPASSLPSSGPTTHERWSLFPRHPRTTTASSALPVGSGRPKSTSRPYQPWNVIPRSLLQSLAVHLENVGDTIIFVNQLLIHIVRGGLVHPSDIEINIGT